MVPSAASGAVLGAKGEVESSTILTSAGSGVPPVGSGRFSDSSVDILDAA